MSFFRGRLAAELLGFEALMEHGLDEYLVAKAQEVEAYAQENAPWEDQTGDARSGLTAEAGKVGLDHFIVLYHTVDYGIWLEIRWDGRFAIIEPTVQHFGPEVMSGMSFGSLLRHSL